MAPRANRREEWPWRGDSSNTLAHIPQALRRGEPRVGRPFVRGQRNVKHTEDRLDVRSYLVGKLGPRGYGRLLQGLTKVTVAEPVKRPARRRRQRRKPVAA